MMIISDSDKYSDVSEENIVPLFIGNRRCAVFTDATMSLAYGPIIAPYYKVSGKIYDATTVAKAFADWLWDTYYVSPSTIPAHRLLDYYRVFRENHLKDYLT